MTVDLTATIVPKSDQLNSDDLMTGPVTVTIESVSAGNAEQPVDVHLVEFPGRAYRPSKSMRRVMVAAWGKESSVYTGHRMTLYRDPEVKFGGTVVGGIKISHLSHIEKRMQIALTETRGKRKVHTVDLLRADAPSSAHTPPPTPVDAWEQDPDAPPAPLTDHTRRQMFAELTKRGITDPAVQRAGMSKILGRAVESRGAITEDEGRAIVLDLMSRPVPTTDAEEPS
jgi:hypothetical protein